MIDELQHAKKLCEEIETARKAHALAITSEQRERVQARAMQRLATMHPETKAVTGDVGDQVVALLGGYSPTGDIASPAESHGDQGDMGDRIILELQKSRAVWLPGAAARPQRPEPAPAAEDLGDRILAAFEQKRACASASGLDAQR